jgi:exopolysaccharide biosynthesis WecB/TagA/CpsF family protein
VYLRDTPVDRIEMAELPAWIEAFIASAQPHQVVTANLDFIAIARRRPGFARIIAAADLVLCDGKPLQWAAQLQRCSIPSRVTGMNLVLQTALLSARRGYRIFLLGAEPGVAEEAAQRIRHLIPGAVIAGCYSPPVGPFSAEENARMVQLIRAARTDALFVAFGAPKQDEWIAQHMPELGVPLCAGVGGVFNFLAGKIRRAPEWMQRAGLEWAFRLGCEPGRLWRRYFVNDLPVFLDLVTDQARLRLTARRALRSARRAAPSRPRLTIVAPPEYPVHSADPIWEQATQRLILRHEADAAEAV